MKNTGIVRRLDDLGRITLPIELRRTLGIDGDRDKIEIFVEDEAIILKKFEPNTRCKICGSKKNVTASHDDEVVICESCAKVVFNMYKE